MYSDNQRRASVNRANDAFLRRMVGGSLSRADMSVMNMENDFKGEANPNRILESQAPALPFLSQSNASRPCFADETSDTVSKSKPKRNQVVSDSKPRCDGSIEGEKGDACPTFVQAPSLAMVYAPRQCWQNLLEPSSALENGSLFAELVLPFECGGVKKTSENDWRAKK